MVAGDIRNDFRSAMMFAEASVRSVVPHGHRTLETYWERRWLARGFGIYAFGVAASVFLRIPAPENLDMFVSGSGSVLLGVYAGSGRMFRPDRKTVKLLYHDVKNIDVIGGSDAQGATYSNPPYINFVDSYVRAVTRTRGAKRAFRDGVALDRASSLHDLLSHQWGRDLLNLDQESVEMAINLATGDTEIGELLEGVSILRNGDDQ